MMKSNFHMDGLKFHPGRVEISSRQTGTCNHHLSFANKIGIEEKWSQSCRQQINWNSIPSETAEESWKISVYLPFLDTAFGEMKPGSVKERGQIMNYAC